MIYAVSFIALLVNGNYNGLLPLLRQFFLIPNRINELWISEHNVSPPACMDSAGILSVPSNVYFFNIAMTISISKGLGKHNCWQSIVDKYCNPEIKILKIIMLISNLLWKSE
jgi:hypothetical protein